MPVRYASFLLLLLLAPAAAAQSTPTAGCETGVAEAELNVAGVRATLYNIGGLFWRGQGSRYEVPKGSGLVPIFNASLMVGGLVDEEVRFAGSTYGPWEFWPGPLGADGTTTPATCAAYDRIWVVRSADLDALDAGGAPTADLAEWPVAVGAPFYVDGNGNGRQDPSEPTVSLDPGDAGYGTRSLDLGAGERPVVFGRQTAWWIMNDMGGPHAWSNRTGQPTVEPLGIEVRATAWVHGGASAPELSESTFYRFEVVNRSAETLRDVHPGLHVDGDLGQFNDDRVGTDSTRHLTVYYNGDEVDDGGGGYGDRPPALGLDVLSGAWAGPIPYKSGGPYGEPSSGGTAYNVLRGLWRDGSPVRVGALGYDTDGPVTRWAFPGDMVLGEFWSQENIDGAGTPLIPSDKKSILSGLPADLAPGERLVFDVGILFASGLSRLDSVTEVLAVSDAAQSLYDVGALTRPVADPPPPPTPTAASPEDEAVIVQDAVPFAWQPVPDAEAYRLDIFGDAEGTAPITSLTVRGPLAEAEVDVLTLPLNRRAPLYWQVRAIRSGLDSEPTALRSFTAYRPVFSRIGVVANASGRLTPPARITFWSDVSTPPTGEGPRPDQQTDQTFWTLTTGRTDVSTYDAFLEAILRDDNDARAFPNDYEIRFGGTHVGALDGGAQIPVPFELWDLGVGTPDDPADDVRMIPVVVDADGDGAFSISPGERSSDGSITDGISWHRPLLEQPGDRGYQLWASGEVSDIGPEVLYGMAFQVFDDDPDSATPEAGTIVRFESAGQALAVAEPEAPATLALDLRPNPTAARATVGFRLDADAEVVLRVVDVLGRVVAVLAEGPRMAGEHRAALDASRLASGIYVLELRAGETRAIRTVTVVR